MTEFTTNVSYGQICVFWPSVEGPFNDWAERHDAQGFAWRRGSVSFATLTEGGPARVRVERTAAYAVPSGPTRIIRVPFDIPADRHLEVGGLFDSVALEIKAGSYSLIFEHSIVGEQMVVKFIFCEQHEPAAILRADGGLSVPDQLCMVAFPA